MIYLLYKWPHFNALNLFILTLICLHLNLKFLLCLIYASCNQRTKDFHPGKLLTTSEKSNPLSDCIFSLSLLLLSSLFSIASLLSLILILVLCSCFPSKLYFGIS
ncbi:hypothetical protein GLOIN_2v1525915 [Rhizophagus irregularis DAOM 181602=DAOM 197198]|uniref:Uncharacterized protein n=1 Tax=Rhizophagus irregularis (strain DAOM 181602 / DAOM 197198 / MUCL 43194) TaxID=747089 RepID=A0A2P4QPF0_RHIID|nr:hypothetical protein GLOIN_2v1525915 [Rhizophagus irregularis DAOM 181602=DAOM 197198]POG79504.1 hypothetical protein GLOIN_2v1525915 [Rhizophagus irregularis DAOM 181602=DAOM 197198]|eukprot:XP_025186370.1 hypothetical protein GLOIN_2v1525915 [Rhizophagus irregularis DAOM 181602=DAOM 197198]